jgi:outer membrane receptor protein involved in Fe transport
LTYRNFGEVTINGIDLSLAYFPNEQLSLNGNYSYVDNTLFKNVDGIADVALNAPGNKGKLGCSYAFRDLPLALGAQFRYVGSFRQDSGVYAGEVDSYASLDLNLGYQLPLEHDLRLGMKVSNVLDNKYRTFVGAPEIGRLLFAQLATSF